MIKDIVVVLVVLVLFACGDSSDGVRVEESQGECVSSMGGAGTFTDCRDRTVYPVVTIGDYTWLAANLNYLPSGVTTWCYDNNQANCDIYGRLYDWNTALTVCPSGWHLSDTTEWNSLIRTLGGEQSASVAANALRDSSSWIDYPNGGTSGFNAQAGGRYFMASYTYLGEFGNWWTSTPNGESLSHMVIFSNSIMILDYYGRSPGFSVRCVQDSV